MVKANMYNILNIFKLICFTIQTAGVRLGDALIALKIWLSGSRNHFGIRFCKFPFSTVSALST